MPRSSAALHDRLHGDSRFLTMFAPELDIVIFAPRAESSREISRLSKQLFDAAAARDLHLALFSYPANLLRDAWPDVGFEGETVTCLRSCLMKPEHLEWGELLWGLLDAAMDAVAR